MSQKFIYKTIELMELSTPPSEFISVASMVRLQFPVLRIRSEASRDATWTRIRSINGNINTDLKIKPAFVLVT